MKAEVSLEEYLREVPAVVPPGESPFESTIQVPDGKEHLVIQEPIPREWTRDAEMMAHCLPQLKRGMARKIGEHIMQHYDPVEIVDGYTGKFARLSIRLRVENTVRRIAQKHQEQGRSEGIAEGQERERLRNKLKLFNYLEAEGLL